MQDPVPDSVALQPHISHSVTADPLGLHPQAPDVFVFNPRNRHPSLETRLLDIPSSVIRVFPIRLSRNCSLSIDALTFCVSEAGFASPAAFAGVAESFPPFPVVLPVGSWRLHSRTCASFRSTSGSLADSDDNANPEMDAERE
jgi:hypothetical protein